VKVVIANKLRLSSIPEKIRTHLMEQMQFVNPKWIENQRMGRWNKGTPKVLKFYRRLPGDGLAIPRGFMRQLYLLSRRHNEPLEIDDRRRKKDEIEFVFQGDLKPFQQTAVDVMLSKDFGTLCAPTGSGKTVMALYMIAKRRQPALVVVHTKELALQWMDRIDSFLKIPRDQIGLIGDSKKRVGDKITVALVQSLHKCAKEVAPRIGYLLVDECHRAPSRTFTEAVVAFDAHYMLGLSATPWRRDHMSKLIFWYLGDVHHDIPKAQLVANGQILDIDVVVRETRFKPYYDPVNEYSKMLLELTSDDQRNHLIAKDVAGEVQDDQKGGVALVLSDRKRHCETLQAILKHKHHVQAELLNGEMPMAKRQEAIQRIRQGQSRVLIATGQLIGEGFDCPQLSILFLATPVSFSGRVLQYLGRILRPTLGVERAKVYDYVDVLVGPLNASAQARQRVYRGGD
jgi:superfamily II DNA or RNA helicase